MTTSAHHADAARYSSAHPLDAVMPALRWSLHALVVGLCAFAMLVGRDQWTMLPLGLAFTGFYVVGAAIDRRRGSIDRSVRHWQPLAWLIVLVALWTCMAFVTPEAVYLVFPLFFVTMNILPGLAGVIGACVLGIIAVTLFGLATRFGVAGVAGPTIGAAVAIVVGLGLQALVREAREREALIADLRETQGRLAAAERMAGAMGERERLARDIHDTVSQSLSSIIMLLHAADLAAAAGKDAARPIDQARDAASEALAETRQLIDELAPPALRQASLADALARLAMEASAASGIDVVASVDGVTTDVPTRIEVAVLRIIQGAVANAVQHSGARHVRVHVRADGSAISLTVADDGHGFDASAAAPTTSYGIRAMQDRAAELDGTLEVASSPTGTIITAAFGGTP